MKPIVAVLLTAALLLSCMSALAVEGEDLAVQMVDKSAYLEQVSTRRCTFQCKYINNDPERTVSGFDLAYVALDRDQNVSMEETTQYIEMLIAPLKTKVSPVIYITNQSELAYLVLAVQTVYFTDGTSQTIDFAAGENYKMYSFRII